MLHKDMRRAERRWRSHHVWMRRLKKDWADHGWGYSIRPLYDIRNGCTVVIGWTDSLCRCFDLRSKQALRFKDTPSLGHSQRSCNGREGDKIVEYKAERWLEAVDGARGSGRRRKRKDLEPRPLKVKCHCGYLLARILVRVGESRYSAISREFGMKVPKCNDCRERSLMPA